jgi:beta-lactamase class A
VQIARASINRREWSTVTTTKKAAAAPPAAQPEADKPKAKRQTLTPAQRVAKLEADLAAAKAKASEKDAKVVTDLQDKRAKLVTQIEDRQENIRVIDKQLSELGVVDLDASGTDVTPDQG